jgi:hypothetical protein
MALLGVQGDNRANRVTDLAQQNRDLARQRQQVAKDLKAEKRKRRKIMEKAQTLSTEDVVEVLAARAKAAANPKAKAKATAKAKAKAP